MTPPQNLPLPVFLRMPYYPLHYLPFNSLTCRILHTHFTVFPDDSVLLPQSWRPDAASCRLSHIVTTLLKYFSTWKLSLNTHKTETILFSKFPAPLFRTAQLCALGLGSTPFKPCARLSMSVHPALVHRRQQSHSRSL